MPKILAVVMKRPEQKKPGVLNYREIHTDADRDAVEKLFQRQQAHHIDSVVKLLPDVGSECNPPFNRGQFDKYFT